jgi:hypothetical protein
MGEGIKGCHSSLCKAPGIMTIFVKFCSVKVGVKIVTDAIPNTIGITFSAMVVLAIYEATFVGHGFL